MNLTMRYMVRLFAALLSLVVLLPALAFASDFYAKRGGWEIYKGSDLCGMTIEFEGPGETTLALLKSADGKLGINVTNSQWTARDDMKYNISYVLNGMTYTDGKAQGVASTGTHGFISVFEPEFERDFAKGSTLVVYLDGLKIDRLSLTGTTVALQAVNSCLAKVRIAMSAEAREQARWADLPSDPFAALPVRNRSATPVGSSTSWALMSDYPSRALRDGRQGVVGFELSVGADGRVQSCVVTSSSGSLDLDATTCGNMTRRARFIPATDAAGKQITGIFSSTVRWSIPDN